MFALLLFFSQNALAFPFLHSNLVSSRTSDQIELHQLQLKYQSTRTDLFWPHVQEPAVLSVKGVSLGYNQGVTPKGSFRGAQIEFYYGEKLSPAFFWQTSLGAENLDKRRTNTSASALIASGLMQWAPNPALNATIELKHGFSYASMMQIGAVEDQIQSTQGILRIANRVKDFRNQLLITGSLLSDQNKRFAVDASSLYKIDEAVNWIWAGVGAERLDFNFRKSNYWSPNSFWSIGPRFEMVIPFADRWQFSSGLNLNYFQESGYSSGYGYYGSTRLQYGLREERNIGLGYTRITSQQNNNVWFSNTLSLEVNYPL